MKTGSRFSCGNSQVSDTAMKDLFNIFSIKRGLVDEIKSDEQQWTPLQNCLADIKNDRTVTAVRAGNDIVRFLDQPIDEEKALDVSRGLSLLRAYVEEQPEESIKLHGLSFNALTLQIEAQIRFTDRKIDVFQNQQDIWDTGFTMLYGERHTVIASASRGSKA